MLDGWLTRPKPFQKVMNLKQGIPNLFLMYSPLRKVGTSENQYKSKDDKVRPKFARPSAHAFPSL